MSNARTLGDIIGAAGTPVISSNASFSANVAVTGAATFSNTVAVTGNAVFSNTITVTGNVAFSNTAAITGNVTFSNTTTHTGAATFSNTVAIGSDYISPYAGFKNRVINGDFRIWQRGTSGTSHATSAYGPDRWRNYGGNALTLTSSTSYGSPQSLLIQASNTNHAIGQRIEAANIADLAGQTVTISYKVRADNPGTHNFLMYYANAVDNWSTETNFVNTAKSYTSNIVTTITHTVTLPAQAANGISIVFQWYNGGSSINITAFIWDVQLEVGSTATSFERRPYGHELQLCKRYYQILCSNNRIDVMRYSGTSTTIYIPYPVEMRTTPTFSLTRNSSVFGSVNTGAGQGGLDPESQNQYGMSLYVYTTSVPDQVGVKATVLASAEL